MYIFNSTFHDYPRMMFDELSIRMNEAKNATYLDRTHSLAQKNGIELYPMVGKYRGYLYPLLLPLNVNNETLLLEFASILTRNYNSLSVDLKEGFSANDLEDIPYIDDLQIFLKTIGQVANQN